MADWVNVAPVAEIPPGSYKTVDIDGADIVVFNVAGSYYAIENICTHDGAKLTSSLGITTLQGDAVVCPRHGARFNVKTGAVLAPPAFEPVSTFPVRTEAGLVQVRDPRWDQEEV